MNAGREMDALVATEVMGWRESSDPYEIGNALIRGSTPVWLWLDDGGIGVARPGGDGRWHPSEDIAAAWEVVERMRALGRPALWSDELGEWWCKIIDHEDSAHGVLAYAATAPLAICLAALKTVGALPDES